MSNNKRRIHSLPPTADGQSSIASTLTNQSYGLSSTLYSPSKSLLNDVNLSLPPSSSAGSRAVSNPTPRPRRAPAAGGFLLDNNSTRSSTDYSYRGSSERDREYASSSILFRNTGRREKQKEREEDTDTDPARMVAMVLSEASRRKRESTTPSRKRASRTPSSHQESSFSTSLQPPPSSPVRNRRESLRRAASPTRAFLVGLPATTGPGRYGSPPPPPRRPNFPGSLSPIPVGDEQEWYNIRSSVGQEKLREVQRQQGFTEATLQRTLKAKQLLELGALYKELLKVDENQSEGGKKGYRYNPLQTIRNRKLRNRKKIQLDISPWEDPSSVELWIEKVGSRNKMLSDEGLPPPPPGEGRVMKRPKMDWVVCPEEMLADYYWMRTEESKHDAMERELRRRKRRSMRDLDSKENKRESFDVSPGDWQVGEGVKRKDSVESSQRKYATTDYSKFFQTSGDYSSTSSSTNTSDSEDGNMYPGTDSEPQSDTQEEDLQKHHRRRRKLAGIIKRKRGHRKSRKSKQDLLEEKRRKHGAEDMHWVQSETDDKNPTPMPLDQPEYRASMDIDEERYELAPTGQAYSPPKLFQSMAASSVPSMTMDSRSSFERFPSAGLGINNGGATTADYVVPSIAISLSPPRVKSKDELEQKDIEKSKGPTKKLIERTKDSLAISTRDREFCDDSGRESLDIDRRKSPERKEKSCGPSKLGKVRTRVDKLRDDFIWKPPGRSDVSSAPSPTGSSFSSEDDSQFPLGTVSDDDASPRKRTPKKRDTRQSLEVPRSDYSKSQSKHRSHFSTSQLPSLSHAFEAARNSLDSSRSPSPERPPNPSRRHRLLHRDRSPARPVPILDPPISIAPPAPHPAQFDEDIDPYPVVISSFRRDPTGSRLIATHTGIMSRHLSSLSPASLCAPATLRAEQLTSTLSAISHQHHIVRTVHLPPLSSRLDAVTSTITALSPALHQIADEADKLEGQVTMELTKQVTAAKEDLTRLARIQKRGRGRWVMLAGWALLEWSLVGVLRVVRVIVWIVGAVRWVIRGVVWAVGRLVRWVLWL